MARKPSFDFERRERAKAKAEKRTEKAKAKAEKKANPNADDAPGGDEATETEESSGT